ncbi:hypothetical protein [Lysinibacillus sp. 54212]|uniref:hypothetical protein n=1 Tax=Lysinibacillus sp. 54212 TaxID=3119829 RepID=UPI002FC989A7
MQVPIKALADAVNQLSEQEAKQLLVSILIAKNYSNQEVLQKVQEIIDDLVKQ